MSSFFFFNDTATTEIYTLSLHDALPIFESAGETGARTADARGRRRASGRDRWRRAGHVARARPRSEEHTSELQSPCNLVCRLLLEKKKTSIRYATDSKTETWSASPSRCA